MGGFERTYDAQVHEMADAIAATVTNAQVGLNWLRAQPLNLEEVYSFPSHRGRKAFLTPRFKAGDNYGPSR